MKSHVSLVPVRTSQPSSTPNQTDIQSVQIRPLSISCAASVSTNNPTEPPFCLLRSSPTTTPFIPQSVCCQPWLAIHRIAIHNDYRMHEIPVNAAGVLSLPLFGSLVFVVSSSVDKPHMIHTLRPSLNDTFSAHKKGKSKQPRTPNHLMFSTPPSCPTDNATSKFIVSTSTTS